MNVTDATIIQAFTVALSQLELILSPDVKHIAHQIGYELEQQHSEKAVVQMCELVQQHRCLEESFQAFYRAFEERYQGNTRVSVLPPSDRTLDLLIETLTIPILRSNEFIASARHIVRQSFQHHGQNDWQSDFIHFFVMCLQKAISASDDQINTILHALEHQLLSVEDIAHLLKIPGEQAHQIVNHLWERGYIDSAKSSVVGRAVAAFIRSPRPIPPTNSTTHFVLTSRGHFHLHPLLIAKREDRLE